MEIDGSQRNVFGDEMIEESDYFNDRGLRDESIRTEGDTRSSTCRRSG